METINSDECREQKSLFPTWKDLYDTIINWIASLSLAMTGDSVSVVKKQKSVSEMVDLYSNDEEGKVKKMDCFVCDIPQLVIASECEAIQHLLMPNVIIVNVIKIALVSFFKK